MKWEFTQVCGYLRESKKLKTPAKKPPIGSEGKDHLLLFFAELASAVLLNISLPSMDTTIKRFGTFTDT
jgi:hypothetical protein